MIVWGIGIQSNIDAMCNFIVVYYDESGGAAQGKALLLRDTPPPMLGSPTIR